MGNKSIGLELRTLTNLIRRYFMYFSHQNKIDNITGNNGWIIGFLINNTDRDIFQKDIEEHFTITRSTASKVLSLMEKKGLIRREKVSKDARLKKIVLTELTLEIGEMMKEFQVNMEQTLVKGFTDDEIETLLSYINRMKYNIENFEKNN